MREMAEYTFVRRRGASSVERTVFVAGVQRAFSSIRDQLSGTE